MNETDGVLRDGGTCLVEQFLTTGQTGTGNGLIGGNLQTNQSRFGIEWLEHGHGRHGRAVRVCDDPLDRLIDCVGVNLRDHEWHVGVHPPSTRVIHHGYAGRGKARCLCLRESSASRKDGDIESGGVGRLSIFDDDVMPVKRNNLSGTAGRGEEANLVDGEISFGEKVPNDGTDLTRGADHSDASAH